MKTRVTLTFDGTKEDFQKSMGADENFDLLDSIFYAMDYCRKGETSYHNNISITVEDDEPMKLYYEGTDKEVKVGDVLTDFRGETGWVVEYFKEPDHGCGKIYVRKDGMGRELYVTVFNLEWR